MPPTDRLTQCVAIFTGNRADWGLLEPVVLALAALMPVQLWIGGDHLPETGLFKAVLSQGVQAVWLELKAETPSKSASNNRMVASTQTHLAAVETALAQQAKPAALLLLGDRFEAFAVALAAFYNQIPLIHLAGGDLTQGGCVDDRLRFLISELASVHCAFSQKSFDRLKKWLESHSLSTQHLVLTGSPLVDNLQAVTLLEKETLYQAVGFNLQHPVVLFTQHPVPAEGEQTVWAYEQTLLALLEAKTTLGVQVVASAPNADGYGEAFRVVLDRLRPQFGPSLVFEETLGTGAYFSWLSACSAVVGNSSSGLYETPYFKTPSISVGSRQLGREHASNVLFCDYGQQNVYNALKTALTDELFAKQVAACVPPFGKKPAAPVIAQQVFKFLQTGLTA